MASENGALVLVLLSSFVGIAAVELMARAVRRVGGGR